MPPALSTSSVGRCGELLAMLALERHGVQASLVDRADHDIWARTKSGRMLTVQVKTASSPVQRGHERLKYYFGGHKEGTQTDVFALVALHAQVVIFCSQSEVGRRFPVEMFTAEKMSASIKEHFA